MLCTGVVALYLTYSRSALLGLASAIAMLAVLKYRRLIPWMIAAALLILLLPVTQGYVERLGMNVITLRPRTTCSRSSTSSVLCARLW